jgi:hypothetical protein
MIVDKPKEIERRNLEEVDLVDDDEMQAALARQRRKMLKVRKPQGEKFFPA